MERWPRELKGHTVAKKIDFVRKADSSGGDTAKPIYLCVKCGVRFEGPEDPKLERVSCRGLTHEWQT